MVITYHFTNWPFPAHTQVTNFYILLTIMLSSIITVPSRIYCFWLSLKIFFHTSHMPQMETSCKLNARCLKKDEPLEACNNPECQNLIHPSCFKKVMSAVAENEWEGLLFCGK